MELKAAYKPTDIGLIPLDWDAKPLRMISPRQSVGLVINPSTYFDDAGSVPMLVGSNIGQNTIDWVCAKRITSASNERLAASRLNAGDLVMVRVGDPGTTAVIPEAFDGCNCASMMIIRKHASFSSQWLCYAMNAHLGRQQVAGVQYGTAQKQFNISDAVNFKYPVPPLIEQEAIATVLSDVDALLEGLDCLLAKKRDLKQAAMQQLLTGKIRLPGFDGEWPLRRLGHHVTFLRNGTNSRAELRLDGPVKYLHYGDVHACTGVFLDPASLPCLPCEKAKALDRLQDGDLVFADASEDLTGVSKSVEIRSLGGAECVPGLHTIAARFDKSVLADGFKGYLQFCPPFSGHLRRLAAGTKVYATNRVHVASVEMKLPGVEEQAAIAAIFQDMDAEIEALEQRRTKTADLKQAMMQELLTGKTRLVEPQAADEQVGAESGNIKGHNWAINEAVVIATLVKHFGKEDYPLGRKRYTKLSYLLHRHVERKAEGYLKKAAGPYNPQTKYGGPEKIAKQNGYIRERKGPKGHSGFIAADNVAQAEGYFEKWYGPEAIQWLEQFRFKKNDDLEVLATVDMAAEELLASGKTVNVAAVKEVIGGHPEWEAKLDRAAFSEANIAEAIKQNESLFGAAVSGGHHA